VGSAEEALALALAKLTGHVEMRPRSLLTAHEDYTTLQFHSPWDLEKPGQVGRIRLLGRAAPHQLCRRPAPALARAHATAQSLPPSRSSLLWPLATTETSLPARWLQVFGFLRKHIPSEDTLNEVKRMTLTADGKGAVFDVPTNLAKVRLRPAPASLCCRLAVPLRRIQLALASLFAASACRHAALSCRVQEEFLDKCGKGEGIRPTGYLTTITSLPELKEREQQQQYGGGASGGFQRGGYGSGYGGGRGGRGGSSNGRGAGRGGSSGGRGFGASRGGRGGFGGRR
jgi:hypothetical protein